MIIRPIYSFTRPSDTTAYAAADLVANSTTAGSVVPMSFDLSKYGTGGSGKIRRVVLYKSTATVTLATFNLHLFSQSPVVTNGDNAAFAVSTAEFFLGTIACDLATGAFATSADVGKAFVANPEINVDLGGGKAYGLLAAGAGYTPASAEVFKVTLEVEKA